MPFKFLPAVTCDDVFELQLETRQMWCKIIECSRIHCSCCSDSNYFMKWTLFFCWFTTMLLYNNEMISLIRPKWLELFVRSLETHSSLRTKDRLPPQIANWWVRLHMNVSRLTPLYGKCPAKIELIALSTHLRQPSISTERKIAWTFKNVYGGATNIFDWILSFLLIHVSIMLLTQFIVCLCNARQCALKVNEDNN